MWWFYIQQIRILKWILFMILAYLNHAGIAQLVEQRFCNPQVPRSIRGAGTRNKNV